MLTVSTGVKLLSISEVRKELQAQLNNVSKLKVTVSDVKLTGLADMRAKIAKQIGDIKVSVTIDNVKVDKSINDIKKQLDELQKKAGSVNIDEGIKKGQDSVNAFNKEAGNVTGASSGIAGITKSYEQLNARITELKANMKELVSMSITEDPNTGNLTSAVLRYKDELGNVATETMRLRVITDEAGEVIDTSFETSKIKADDAIEKVAKLKQGLVDMKQSLGSKLDAMKGNDIIDPKVIEELRNKLNGIDPTNVKKAQEELSKLQVTITNLGSGQKGIVAVENGIQKLEYAMSQASQKMKSIGGDASVLSQYKQMEVELQRLIDLRSQMTQGTNVSNEVITRQLNSATQAQKELTIAVTDSVNAETKRNTEIKNSSNFLDSLIIKLEKYRQDLSNADLGTLGAMSQTMEIDKEIAKLQQLKDAETVLSQEQKNRYSLSIDGIKNETNEMIKLTQQINETKRVLSGKLDGLQGNMLISPEVIDRLTEKLNAIDPTNLKKAVEEAKLLTETINILGSGQTGIVRLENSINKIGYAMQQAQNKMSGATNLNEYKQLEIEYQKLIELRNKLSNGEKVGNETISKQINNTTLAQKALNDTISASLTEEQKRSNAVNATANFLDKLIIKLEQYKNNLNGLNGTDSNNMTNQINILIEKYDKLIYENQILSGAEKNRISATVQAMKSQTNEIVNQTQKLQEQRNKLNTKVDVLDKNNFLD